MFTSWVRVIKIHPVPSGVTTVVGRIIGQKEKNYRPVKSMVWMLLKPVHCLQTFNEVATTLAPSQTNLESRLRAQPELLELAWESNPFPPNP